MVQLADGRLKRHIIYTQIINDPVVALVALDVILKIKTDIYVSKGLFIWRKFPLHFPVSPVSP